MIFGTLENGSTCVYDLPFKVETAEEFTALITGYNDNPWQREELQNQPILKGLSGPMYNGTAIRSSNGEEVTVIRYENPSKY